MAVLFLMLTLALSHSAAKQVHTLTLSDMENQVNGIGDMAGMFNTTLAEEVSNYTGLFQSFLPKRFTLDESQQIVVGGNPRQRCAPGCAPSTSTRCWWMTSRIAPGRLPLSLP